MTFGGWKTFSGQDHVLPPGEVHVWSFDLDVSSPRESEFEAVLTADEAARAQRFRFPKDRARFVAARGYLREIVARYVGVSPASIEFAYSRYGKPSLSNGPAIGAVRFNATGSDAVGMVAVRRDAEVGIDVERLRDFPDALAVAKRMLTSTEQNELLVLSGDMRAHRFFEYWARKEAVVKSLARGVWQSFDDFTPVPSDTEAMDCVRLSYEGAESREWVMTLASPRPGFVAALSTGAPVRVVRGFLLGTAAETATE